MKLSYANLVITNIIEMKTKTPNNGEIKWECTECMEEVCYRCLSGL